MMGVEEGSSWHDYIMDNTVKQMTMVQRGLKQAQEEGYQFPASVQEQYEDSLNSLKTSAESTGMSVKAYLQRNLGAIMTEKVYNQQVLRMLQYQGIRPELFRQPDLHRRGAGSRLSGRSQGL